MTDFNRALEGIDLTGIHLSLTIFGGLLACYVMQLTHSEAEDVADPWIVRKASRFSLALIAMAMLWSAWYSIARQWQPWPPEILLVFGIDLALVIRLVAIKARIGRTGHRDWDKAAALRDFLRKHG